jgi:sigma-E factor negative regulatory protein RseA
MGDGMLEIAMPEDGLDPQRESWEVLSSLVDGEASADEQARCLARWNGTGELRSRWHEYQLIGDAMRSDELVVNTSRDAAFLRSVRDRLAREPVHHLAPEAAPRRMPVWIGPVAVAAGVGAVALTLSALGPLGAGAGSGGADQRMAAARASAALPAAAAEPQVRMVSGQLIRDARLDRYLAAHRQGAVGTSLQMPGTVVRSVDTLVLESR